MDFLVPSQSTLVKYNGPSLIPPPPPPPPSPRNRVETLKQKPTEFDLANEIPKTPQQLMCKDIGKSGLRLEEILDILLPPKVWLEHGVQMRQTVSSESANRLDVVNLREQLNARLEVRQARPKGICLIRHELYGQCFDELIRQIAINCPERGLLLIRIRDEIRMTQNAYRTLYETAAAHTLKKEEEADEGLDELEEKYKQAVDERKQMLRNIQERRIQIDQAERRHFEFMEAENKRFNKESELLKRAYVQIQEQHDRIVNYHNKLK